MLHVWVQDCMTRIFPDQEPPENPKKEMCLHIARNEVGCFQIGISGLPTDLNDLRVEVSALVSESGERITKENIDVLYAENVPVHWHSAGNTPDDLDGLQQNGTWDVSHLQRLIIGLSPLLAA